MRGLHAVAAALAATFLVAPLLLAVPAAGADSASPWAGTYAGSGKGKAIHGTKEVEAALTVWVEDAGGGNAKVTFRVDKYGLTMESAAEVEPQTNGSYIIPVDVSDYTISASAVLTVTPQGGKMVMSGQGADIALGREGTGTMGGRADVGWRRVSVVGGADHRYAQRHRQRPGQGQERPGAGSQGSSDQRDADFLAGAGAAGAAAGHRPADLRHGAPLSHLHVSRPRTRLGWGVHRPEIAGAVAVCESGSECRKQQGGES